MIKPILAIRSEILAQPTYVEFKHAFQDRYGRFPVGSEVLTYWAGNRAEERRMCPNPARVRQ